MGSVRSAGEFVVHPNDLKTLKIGECYLKTTLPSGKVFIKKFKHMFSKKKKTQNVFFCHFFLDGCFEFV